MTEIEQRRADYEVGSAIREQYNAELVQTSTLFGTDNPAEVVERAAKVATTLADLVRQQNLIVRIGQSDHVRVEGWTLLGSMLGVFPVVAWTHPIFEGETPVGWEARVEAKTRAGEVVGAAEAECLRSEKTWGKRDDYALRSMAQTRAVSKALRLPLGFVMQLAGFNPTPAEEMTGSAGEPEAGGAHSPPVAQATRGEPASPADVRRTAQQLAGYEAHSPGADALAAPGDDGWDSTQILEGKVAAPPRTILDDLASEAQRKKLDVLVKGTVKPPIRRVWVTVAAMRLKDADYLIAELGGMKNAEGVEDGVLHWSPLRDALTAREAHKLIDKLEAQEAQA